jgi:hypothetical protein
MFTLYRAKISNNPDTKGMYAYAWINPSGICFTSRDMLPLGWHANADDAFQGLTRTELTSEWGFSKASTKMTQEQLSKGWFC